ncbi:hypothetical protein PV416_22775 [Streptomyces ipomoeae]|uniref:hypothetical protein n=1 Tax=Streptomyces ipomoeae TaxID=103232 RepID=UPI0011472B40|nr:hypothetical protein [Streptomyces ipomoeae]MDX2823844.1 hypothetical protein [Streptomyces ipomoeae]MDX2876452.1 hypothetical protein [Streptomyces ipomoeae]TQE26288.1 hypothetical protein Sipo7851_33435 [Streptomyces ipomoeae]
MRTESLLDTPLATGTVTVEIRAEEPLGAPLVRFVESIFRNTSLMVSTQGLSTGGRDDAVLRVESFRTSQDGAGVVVELTCAVVPSSAWRVLVGRLHAFDVSAATLSSLSLRQNGRTGTPRSEESLFAADCPAALGGDPGFPLSYSQSGSHQASLDVELKPGVTKEQREEVIAALNAWLQTREGGFFEPGHHPVTAAHDCPAIEEVSELLPAARFDNWVVTEEAFHVALRQLAYLQRRYGCIGAVEVR